jgi:hypothetical protein
LTSGSAEIGSMSPAHWVENAQLISKPYRLSTLAQKVRDMLNQG